jgi:hypothetical protein
MQAGAAALIGFEAAYVVGRKILEIVSVDVLPLDYDRLNAEVLEIPVEVFRMMFGADLGYRVLPTREPCRELD